MLTVLVPVGGSECAGRAIDHLIRNMDWFKDGAQIHLLNVQHAMPYGNRVSSAVGRDRIDQYHHEEGMAALKSAMQKLDAAKIRYHCHIGVGDEAQIIIQCSEEIGCHQIIMGTRGMDPVSNLLLGSVASKVIQLAKVPVVLVK